MVLHALQYCFYVSLQKNIENKFSKMVNNSINDIHMNPLQQSEFFAFAGVTKINLFFTDAMPNEPGRLPVLYSEVRKW